MLYCKCHHYICSNLFLPNIWLHIVRLSCAIPSFRLNFKAIWLSLYDSCIFINIKDFQRNTVTLPTLHLLLYVSSFFSVSKEYLPGRPCRNHAFSGWFYIPRLKWSNFTRKGGSAWSVWTASEVRPNPNYSRIKGTVAWDFQTLFFHKLVVPSPLIHTLKYFHHLLRFHWVIGLFEKKLRV